MNASLTKHLLLPLALAAALSACGGGSSPDTTTSIPATPTLDPDYDIRQLVFSWAAVAGADYYRLFENIDGASGYVRIGADLTGTDYRHDISVLTQDWPNASYLVEACNAAGCAESSAVFATESARAIGYFKASDTVSEDGFGFDVAMSGDGTTLVAGAPFKNGDTGAAYVFGNTDGSWSQQLILTADDGAGTDTFGRRVALSQDGNTLAIAARNKDGGAGAVYVFIRSATGWDQSPFIQASNTEGGDNFGYSVTLSADGGTLAVGAIGEDSNATGVINDDPGNAAEANPDALNAGAAYVFTRNLDDTWTQKAYIKASNTGAGDSFGYAVTLSADGTTLAVGAIQEDSDAGGIDQVFNEDASNAGAVYLYRLDGAGDWVQQAYIKAAIPNSNNYFGRSVSLSSDGNTLAVGAYGEASNSTTINVGEGNTDALNAGAAYVFHHNGISWAPQAYIKAPNAEEGDHFGFALDLSIDGNVLAVGAANNLGTGGEGSAAIGIDGNMADNSRTNSGAVYLFHRDGSTWSNGVYVKASNTGANDVFGAALSLSDDGQSMVVGAHGEEDVSGAAYLY